MTRSPAAKPDPAGVFEISPGLSWPVNWLTQPISASSRKAAAGRLTPLGVMTAVAAFRTIESWPHRLSYPTWWLTVQDLPFSGGSDLHQRMDMTKEDWLRQRTLCAVRQRAVRISQGEPV
jgi:hypothetical protein